MVVVEGEGEGDEDEEEPYQAIDPGLIEPSSWVRGAIPVLPVQAAIVCCVLNVFVPGMGERRRRNKGIRAQYILWMSGNLLFKAQS